MINPAIKEKYPNFSLSEFLKDNGITFYKNQSDKHIEYSTNCPKCIERGEPSPDESQKLWINSETGFFHCYRCSWEGSLIRLVQQLSNASLEASIKILSGKIKEGGLEYLNFSLHVPHVEEDDEDEELKEIDFPYGFTLFEKHPRKHSRFTKYLSKRGISFRYAVDHGWGYATTGYVRDRIVVPTYMDQKLVFWQARDILESKHEFWGDKKKYRKVLNPKGVSASHVLYNFDEARVHRTIILVEGMIDSTKAGPNSMAMNGKMLHDAQVNWLLKSKAEEIIIVLDHDAFHDGRGKKPCSVDRAAGKLKQFFKVKVCDLGEGVDCGDHDAKTLREIIYARSVEHRSGNRDFGD